MSKPAAVSTFLGLARPLKKRAFCQCASKLQTRTSTVSRAFTTFTAKPVEPNPYTDPSEYRPRWQAPPPQMTAPYRSKPPVEGNEYFVNEDPAKLDKVYDRILGENGHDLITEEVRWLAVTHKSFDHGRRGYNDRLAFFGRRIVELQISLALVHAPPGPASFIEDEFRREPFRHPALEGLVGLSESSKSRVLDKKRIALLAESYGLDGVVRWKPKNSKNMKSSGRPIILSQALYAIVGAMSLQRGGVAANDVVKDKILSPLGLR